MVSGSVSGYYLLFSFGTFDFSWLFWAEIECTMHIALPNKPVKTSLAKQPTVQLYRL